MSWKARTRWIWQPGGLGSICRRWTLHKSRTKVRGNSWKLIFLIKDWNNRLVGVLKRRSFLSAFSECQRGVKSSKMHGWVNVKCCAEMLPSSSGNLNFRHQRGRGKAAGHNALLSVSAIFINFREGLVGFWLKELEDVLVRIVYSFLKPSQIEITRVSLEECAEKHIWLFRLERFFHGAIHHSTFTPSWPQNFRDEKHLHLFCGGLSSKNNASSSSLALHYSLHQKAFFQKHHHSWPYHHVDSHFVVRFDPPASACLAFFKLKSGKKRIPRATEKKLHNVYGWRFVPDYARVTALRMTIRSSLPMLRKPCSQSKSLHGILLLHFYFKLNGVRRRCFSRHNFVIYKYFSER